MTTKFYGGYCIVRGSFTKNNYFSNIYLGFNEEYMSCSKLFIFFYQIYVTLYCYNVVLNVKYTNFNS